MAGSLDRDGRPDPSEVGTAAEFVDALRRLKNWSGVGFRRLERRAAEAGQALPRSTITAALNRDALPREDLVVALVGTCGGDQDEVDRWLAARRRIAAGVSPAAPSPPQPSPPPPPPAPPAPKARLVVAVLLAMTVVLTSADAGRDVTVDALPAPSATGGESVKQASDQTPVDRAVALFATAEELAEQGMSAGAQAALVDAVRSYDELARISPEQNGLPLAPYVIQALSRIGVDFSIPEADLRDWLANPHSTPYPAISQALLRSGWRFKAPVHLDVISWNYEHTPGVASPRHLTDVRLDALEAAILEGSNARHGTQVRDFAQLLQL